MEEIKQNLIKIATQNKKEDLKFNIHYWNEVIEDIKYNCINETKLLDIIKNNFGFDSIEEVKKYKIYLS